MEAITQQASAVASAPEFFYEADEPRLVDAYEHAFDPPNFPRDSSGSFVVEDGVDSHELVTYFAPAGNEEWSPNTLSCISCQSLTKLQDLAQQLELVSSIESPESHCLLASTFKCHRLVLLLIDSRAHMTQIHADLAHLLRPGSIRLLGTPIQLVTASSDDGPICKYISTLDFYLPGYKFMLSLECLLRLGDSHLLLISKRDLHAWRAPDCTQQRLCFWDNTIRLGDTQCSMLRVHEMLYAAVVIPQRDTDSQCPYKLSHALSAIAQHPASNCADYIHSLLGHAHLQACARTAEKAKSSLPVLPKGAFNALDESLCSTCAHGIRKARCGQGHLSHCLPHQTSRGEILTLDMIGPFPVQGLFNESFVVHFHDITSSRKEARAIVTKGDALCAARNMLATLTSILKATKQLDEELAFIVHCNNNTVFTSAEFTAMVHGFGGRLHYGAPYYARTCPHI